MTLFPRRTDQTLPRVVEVPRPDAVSEYAPPTSRRTQLSEEAARSAQVVIDLHHEVDTLKTQLDTCRSHVSVLEESNTLIHEASAALKRDNERLLIENTVIHTRLRDAITILVGIMRPLTDTDITQLRDAAPEPPAAPPSNEGTP